MKRPIPERVWIYAVVPMPEGNIVTGFDGVYPSQTEPLAEYVRVEPVCAVTEGGRGMTDRKDALTVLRAIVADGLNPNMAHIDAAFDLASSPGVTPFLTWFHFICRHDDIRSLGAAKALHDAVLPGWPWSLMMLDDACVAWTDRAYGLRRIGYFGRTRDDPARAWLVAILSALIAEAGE